MKTNSSLKPIAMAIILSTSLIAADFASAQAARPRQQQSLYYRLGGGDPAAGANHPGSISARLGVGGNLRMAYSCGKFDLGLSWQNLMNGFSQLGTQITNAVQAGISALPLYILQRAQPGLYQLFQTYAAKADLAISQALKSCEEMEAQIKKGGDPYEDFLQLAKGEGWKIQSSIGSDVVSAKSAVETKGGREGTTWIGGTPAGGASQRPISVIKDVVEAGYNVTLNQPANTDASFEYTNVTSTSASKLVKAFGHPDPHTGLANAKSLAAQLEKNYPGAAASLREVGAGRRALVETAELDAALGSLGEQLRRDGQHRGRGGAGRGVLAGEQLAGLGRPRQQLGVERQPVGVDLDMMAQAAQDCCGWDWP